MTQAAPALVSILIRSMDRATLRRAIDSAAAQTWPNLEIVVVSACGRSHRVLPDLHRGRPLRLVLPETDRRLTRPQAANAALDAAHGEWLNFLDDDDELLPQHVTTLLGEKRGERVIYSRARAVDLHGGLLGHVGHDGNHVQLYFHSRATPCAMLLHRSLVDEGARFDPAFVVHEDHDFQVNCATRTEFHFVDRATSIWHAQAGDSGCGFGANDDRAQRRMYADRVRQKWARPFTRWLGDADAVLFTGQQYLKGDDLFSAKVCFEQVLRLRPDDVNAMNLCGMAELRDGNLDRAEAMFMQALLLIPDHAGLRGNLELLRRTRAQQAASQQ